MSLSLSASGETDLCFLANAWITMDGFGKLKTENGEESFSVGTYEGADKSFNVTVSGKHESGGSDGAKMEIEFCACQSDTVWTYEWRKVGN